MTPEKIDLHNYSEENLQGISKVIKIITDHLELSRRNRLTNLIKIPLITLEKIGISYEEAQIVIGGINKINEDILLTIINEEPYKMLRSSDSGFMFPRFTDELSEEVRKRDLLQEWLFATGRLINVYEDDLKNKLLIRLSVKTSQEPLEILNNYKKVVDKRLAEINPDRANQRAIFQKIIKKNEEMETIKNEVIAEIQKAQSNTKKPSSPELYLNVVGDLWREPKNKYCYPMGEKSDRHKIIRYLITNNGYQQTLDISSALEGKSKQSIRTEIAKIRNNIKKFLKIDGKQVIGEGRKGSGYTIGSKYKIKIIA